jgi:hypothetical protein
VARSSFQERTRGISSSIPKGNNAWPVRMPLRTSRISRPPLMGRKLRFLYNSRHKKLSPLNICDEHKIPSLLMTDSIPSLKYVANSYYSSSDKGHEKKSFQ